MIDTCWNMCLTFEFKTSSDSRPFNKIRNTKEGRLGNLRSKEDKYRLIFRIWVLLWTWWVWVSHVLVAQSCPTLCNPMDCSLPLSMEFSRQEYWSRFPFLSAGDLPNPGIEPRSPALQANFLVSETPEKPNMNIHLKKKSRKKKDI